MLKPASEEEKKVVHKAFNALITMWGLTKAESNGLLGLSDDAESLRILDTDEPFLRACNVLYVYRGVGGGEEHGLRWLREPNPMLDWDTPLKALSREQEASDNVARLVMATENLQRAWEEDGPNEHSI